MQSLRYQLKSYPHDHSQNTEYLISVLLDPPLVFPSGLQHLVTFAVAQVLKPKVLISFYPLIRLFLTAWWDHSSHALVPKWQQKFHSSLRSCRLLSFIINLYVKFYTYRIITPLCNTLSCEPTASRETFTGSTTLGMDHIIGHVFRSNPLATAVGCLWIIWLNEGREQSLLSLFFMVADWKSETSTDRKPWRPLFLELVHSELRA